MIVVPGRYPPTMVKGCSTILSLVMAEIPNCSSLQFHISGVSEISKNVATASWYMAFTSFNVVLLPVPPIDMM